MSNSQKKTHAGHNWAALQDAWTVSLRFRIVARSAAVNA